MAPVCAVLCGAVLPCTSRSPAGMFDFVPYDLLFGGLLSPSRRDLVADVNPAKAAAPQVDSNVGPNDFMSPRKVRACVVVGAVER